MMQLVCALMLSAAVGAAAQDVAGSQASLTTLLQPSTVSLAQAVGGVRLEKWKLSNEARGAVDSYLTSITRDVNETLPALVRDADAAPAEGAKLLAVSQNVNALYDVLLRVAATSEVAAATEQVNALEAAAVQLRDARRGLDERVAAMVAGQSKSIASLKTQLAQANTDLATAKAQIAADATAAAAKKKSTKKKAATK